MNGNRLHISKQYTKACQKSLTINRLFVFAVVQPDELTVLSATINAPVRKKQKKKKSSLSKKRSRETAPIVNDDGTVDLIDLTSAASPPKQRPRFRLIPPPNSTSAPFDFSSSPFTDSSSLLSQSVSPSLPSEMSQEDVVEQLKRHLKCPVSYERGRNVVAKISENSVFFSQLFFCSLTVMLQICCDEIKEFTVTKCGHSFCKNAHG